MIAAILLVLAQTLMIVWVTLLEREVRQHRKLLSILLGATFFEDKATKSLVKDIRQKCTDHMKGLK